MNDHYENIMDKNTYKRMLKILETGYDMKIKRARSHKFPDLKYMNVEIKKGKSVYTASEKRACDAINNLYEQAFKRLELVPAEDVEGGWIFKLPEGKTIDDFQIVIK
jgi:hypothetical protein